MSAANATKICAKTGLRFDSSLNHSLQTFLHLCDIYWVLAVMTIDNINEMNDKLGHLNVENKIN